MHMLFGSTLQQGPAREEGRGAFARASLFAVGLHVLALLGLGICTSRQAGQELSSGSGGVEFDLTVRFRGPRAPAPAASSTPKQLASRPAPVRRRAPKPAPVLTAPSPVPEPTLAPREPAEVEGTENAPVEVAERASTEVASGSEAGSGGSGVLGGGVGGSFEGEEGLMPPPPPPPELTREQRRTLTSRYLQEIFRSRIAARFHYPSEAEQLGLEGLVTLRVSIDRSGQLLGMRVQGHCPHPMLCDAALRTVRESVPFPPPPSELGGSIAVDVPFQYRLE
jgi:periplasmic protein TonB